MKIKLIALALLMMLLVGPIGKIVHAQGPGDDGQIDPVIYEQIKLQTENRYMELYRLFFGQPDTDSDDWGDDGPVFPDDVDPALRDQFTHAWSEMHQGEERGESDPRAAANQYLRAMKQLRNAFRKYQEDNPGVVDQDPETEGIPESEVPVESTAEELSEVQEQLVKRFQERFQEWVAQMFETYNDVEGDLLPGDAVKAFSALTKTDQKLLRIQEKIHAGAFDEALEDLDDTTDDMGDDFDSMEDIGSKQMFRTMNKLEARIARRVEQAARKAAKGQDTSDEDDLIAQLRGNKDHTKNDFKDNKGKGNN